MIQCIHLLNFEPTASTPCLYRITGRPYWMHPCLIVYSPFKGISQQVKYGHLKPMSQQPLQSTTALLRPIEAMTISGIITSMINSPGRGYYQGRFVQWSRGTPLLNNFNDWNASWCFLALAYTNNLVPTNCTIGTTQSALESNARLFTTTPRRCLPIPP